MTTFAAFKIQLKRIAEQGNAPLIAAVDAVLRPESDKINDWFVFKARFAALEKDRRFGNMTAEEYAKNTNFLAQGILWFIDNELTEADIDTTKLPTSDKPLQTAPRGEILYRVPREMQLQKTVKCLVRIAVSNELVQQNWTMEATDTQKTIRIGNRMEVQIIDMSGKTFEITAVNHAQQIIDKEDLTEWTFYVKPLQTGAHLLLLRVSIVEKIDNENVSKDIVLEEQVTIVTDAVAEPTATDFKTADYNLSPTVTSGGGGGNFWQKMVRRFAPVVLLTLFSVATVTAYPRVRDEIAWHNATTEGTKQAYEAYKKDYPKGVYHKEAEVLTETIQAFEALTPEQREQAFIEILKTPNIDESIKKILEDYQENIDILPTTLKNITPLPTPIATPEAATPAVKAQAAKKEAIIEALKIKLAQPIATTTTEPGLPIAQKLQTVFVQKIETISKSVPKTTEKPVTILQKKDTLALKPDTKTTTTLQPSLADTKKTNASSATVGAANVVAPQTAFTMPIMVTVKSGSFTMGDADISGATPHTVTVGDFEIGKYEITVAEYLAFCDDTKMHYPEWLEVGSKYHVETGSDDEYKKLGYSRKAEAARLPIVGVSHEDATAYCTWLSSKNKGKTYRLPTEAEWEYAARANKPDLKYAGSNDLDEVAWHGGNSDDKTHNVGGKKANAFGLHDMSGNVWEWCKDKYDADYYKNSPQNNPENTTKGSYRVNRGGSWYSDATFCRTANRGSYAPTYRDRRIGFRLCRSL